MLLLDSNIIIYASHPQNEFLHSWLNRPDASASAISIPEVLGYSELAAEDEALFRAWFQELYVHDVTIQVLNEAASLRRQRRMRLGDAVIAATALLGDLILVTRNTKDFRHLPSLRCLDPFDS